MPTPPAAPAYQPPRPAPAAQPTPPPPPVQPPAAATPEDPAPEPARRSSKPLIIGVASVAVLALGLGGAALIALGGSDEPAEASPANGDAGVSLAERPTDDAAAPAGEFCSEATYGDTIVGAGAGGHGNGADAILGFDHAYYVLRSGERAWDFVAPESSMVPPGEVQANIDQHIPEGTEHCLTITPATEPGVYAVTLGELRPDGTSAEYKQRITTVEVDGRHFVDRIEGAG